VCRVYGWLKLRNGKSLTEGDLGNGYAHCTVENIVGNLFVHCDAYSVISLLRYVSSVEREKRL